MILSTSPVAEAGRVKTPEQDHLFLINLARSSGAICQLYWASDWLDNRYPIEYPNPESCIGVVSNNQTENVRLSNFKGPPPSFILITKINFSIITRLRILAWYSGPSTLKASPTFPRTSSLFITRASSTLCLGTPYVLPFVDVNEYLDAKPLPLHLEGSTLICLMATIRATPELPVPSLMVGAGRSVRHILRRWVRHWVQRRSQRSLGRLHGEHGNSRSPDERESKEQASGEKKTSCISE